MLQNNLALLLLNDSVWLDKSKYDDAERVYYETQAQKDKVLHHKSPTSLAEEIASARKRIQNSLKSANVKFEPDESYNQKIQNLENAVSELKSLVKELQTQLSKAVGRIHALESPKPKPPVEKPHPPADKSGDEGDDDIDLFGSDEDDEDTTKLREERLKAYETKKSKKGPLVAKSSVVLDVKPWDDETDMKQMEVKVREVTSEGLVWGASKLVPLAYGIQKLQIVAIVEDDKVSIDWLQETIQEIEDFVQSVDIAAFNKL